jgi:hypothetical protein
MLSKTDLQSIISTSENQLNYIKSKYNGYTSSDMQLFFSQKLSNEAYQYVFDDMIKSENFDTRILIPIISSPNTPIEWSLKFYNQFSNEEFNISCFSKKSYLDKKDLKKSVKNQLKMLDDAFAENPKCPLEIFNGFVENGLNRVILNCSLFSYDDFVKYISKKNNKKLSKKEFNQILSYVSNRKILNKDFINFLTNNGKGSHLNSLLHLSYYKQPYENTFYNNLLDNNFELFNYLFHKAIESDSLNAIEMNSFVKKFVETGLFLNREICEYSFSDEIISILNNYHPNIYKKLFVKSDIENKKIFKI